MKKRGLKRKGMRAILCGLLSFACIVLGSMNVLAAGYTSDNHPRRVYSPDGTGWTIVDALPQYENPDASEMKDYFYSCWMEEGAQIDTGIPTNLPNPGVGQHTYSYNREGYAPVDYWEVEWDKAKCIHDYGDSSYRGYMDMDDSKCWCAYWSGLIPYCADCGQMLVYQLHYISPQSAATLQYVNLDKVYYYICPYNDRHEGRKLEMGPEEYDHECVAVSYNRYKVIYHKNGMGAIGAMAPSYHTYNNADMIDGKPVDVNKYLNLNRYTREGYVFKGWNTKPDGTGQSFSDGQEILNLTDEHYDPNDVANRNKGIVYLYAQWEPCLSHLKIDAKGGVYDDGVGVVNGDKTTYKNKPYGKKQTLSEEYLTPPMGYKVSFVTNCAERISPMRAPKVFDGWKKGTPFTGRLLNDVFEYLGAHNTWSVVEATYNNGSIKLPKCSNNDEVLVAWYKDPALTEIAGTPDSFYTPDSDVTLYAKWEKDLVLYAKNDLEVDGGKGGVDLSWEASGGLNKSFKIFQKLQTESNAAWKQMLSANNIGESLSVNETYVYTNTEKVYKVPYSGFYSFKVYGAQGGDYGSNKGGKGGYVEADIWLEAGDELLINVGGKNGYNGGGIRGGFN